LFQSCGSISKYLKKKSEKSDLSFKKPVANFIHHFFLIGFADGQADVFEPQLIVFNGLNGIHRYEKRFVHAYKQFSRQLLFYSFKKVR